MFKKDIDAVLEFLFALGGQLHNLTDELLTQSIFMKFYELIDRSQPSSLKSLKYNFVKALFNNKTGPLEWEFKKIQDQYIESFKQAQPKHMLCINDMPSGSRAFRCHDCAVKTIDPKLCQVCFLNSEHVNHNFQEMTVGREGAFCRCRSDQKWKVERLKDCRKHNSKQCNNRQREEQEDLFLDRMKPLLCLLFNLYDHFVKFSFYSQEVNFNISNRRKVQKTLNKISEKIDFFGEKCFEMLVNFVENRKLRKEKLEKLLLSSAITELKMIFQFRNGGWQGSTILNLLMKLCELERTVEKLKCLFVPMMYDLGTFKKEVMFEFIQNCQADSLYLGTHFELFSFQITTNAKSLGELLTNKLISPLIFNSQIGEKKVGNFKNDRERKAKAFLEYYYCLDNLIDSHSYEGFQHIPYLLHAIDASQLSKHRMIFNAGNPSNSLNYKIQYQYLLLITRIIRIIKNDKPLMKKCMTELFNYFAKTSTFKVNSALRSQQRSFTLFTLAYLNGQIQTLSEHQVMSQFLMFISFDKSDWQNIINFQIKNIAQILMTISISKSDKSNEEFLKFILEKDCLILCLDQLFLKIILKIEAFMESKMERQFDLAFFVGSKMDDMVDQNGKNGLNEKEQMDEDEKEEEKKLSEKRSIFSGECEVFQTYLTLILGSFSSNLPLMIACDTLASLGVNQHQNHSFSFSESLTSQYFKLYDSILAACGTITFDNFETICSHFLSNGILFKQFIRKSLFDTETTILKAKNHTKTFNIIHYKFIKSKIQRHNLKFSDQLGDLPPNQQKYKEGSLLLLNSNIIENIIYAEQKLRTFNNQQLKSLYHELVQNIFLMNLLLPNQTKITSLIASLLPTLEYTWISEDLCKQIKTNFNQWESRKESEQQIEVQMILFSEQKINQNQELVKNQEQKRLRKKQILQKAKLKNKQVLQIYHSPNLQLSRSMSDTNKLKCLICKENDQNKCLSYLCYVSASDLYGSLDLSPSQLFLVFKICSDKHAVHKECFKSLDEGENRVTCPLCRRTVNLLLPISLDSFLCKKQNKEEALNELILSILSSIQKLNILNCYIESEMINILLISLQTQIIFSSVFNQNHFLFNLPALKIVYDLIKLYYIHKEAAKHYFDAAVDFNKHKILINPISFFAFKFVREYLKSSFQEIDVKPQEKYQGNLDPKYLNILKNFLQLLVGSSNKLNESLSESHEGGSESQKYLERSLKIHELADNLMELSERQCSNCYQTTNRMMICMLCQGFKRCLNCGQKKLQNHCTEIHRGTSIIVESWTGRMVYVSQTNSKVIEQLYRNQFGQSYSNEHFDSNQKKQFKLNLKIVDKMMKDIFCFNLQQEIESDS